MENKNILKTEQIIKVSWEKIQIEMKQKFGKDIYDSWLRKISLEEEFNNYILLSVTTRFIRDWITSRYLDQILGIVKSYKTEISRIELSVNEEQSNNETKKLDYKNQNSQKIMYHLLKITFFSIIVLIQIKVLKILLLEQVINLHLKHQRKFHTKLLIITLCIFMEV